MKIHKTTLAGVCLGLGALALLAPTLASGNARTIAGTGKAAAAIAKPFIAQLSGANETPTAGDTDGDGAAAVTIDPVSGEICFDLRVSNIAAATLSHIHRGAVGVAGPVVVDFVAPTTGTSSGCIVVAAALALEISGNPAGFYVNVHNADFTAGAIRGQLVASPTTSGATRLLPEPLRAYDSRGTDGVLANLATRTISIGKGVNGANGVAIAVPPGATGALIRVTVTDTTGPGFLKVYSNALATAPATSDVNWNEAGAITGANLTVAVDPEAKIKVTAGGGGSTQVVVDVVGYIF